MADSPPSIRNRSRAWLPSTAPPAHCAAYLALRRPLRWAALAGGLLLLVTVVFNRTSVITQQAETLAFITLAPFAFDVFDRRSVDPSAPDRPASRCGLWAALLVIPLGVSILRDHDLQGLAGEAVRYTSRLTEAFLGTLLVGVYLWLRRRTAGSLDGPPAILR